MKRATRAIAVLGGWMIKNSDGTWRTAYLDERDEFGILGDRLRVLAARRLFSKMEDAVLIVSGGKGRLRALKPPSVSSVLKKELMVLGVPSACIVEDRFSDNTHQQLKGILRVVKRRKIKDISIVSNSWHIPRICAMMNQTKDLEDLKALRPRLIAAESLLSRSDARWRKRIQKAQRSSAWKKRLVYEKNGVAAIKEGTYRFQ